jgi:hypothetical protein
MDIYEKVAKAIYNVLPDVPEDIGIDNNIVTFRKPTNDKTI